MKNDIDAYIKRWAKQKMDRAEILAKEKAIEIEQDMKKHAPWQDQTGEARRQLQANVARTDHEIGIRIRHGVEYGVFLENMKNGTLAIIRPTFQKHRYLPKEILEKAIKE